MSYKEYEKLNFDSIYRAKGYPKETWPILNEYLSRYKHEFDLTDNEIKYKLDILASNLDSIRIVKKPKESYMGVYKTGEKEIDINASKLKNLHMNDEDVLDTFFHELNHVCENNSNNVYSTSFQTYNPKTNAFEGTALNEIITEMKASRLAKNDRTDLLKKKGAERSYLNLNGYGDLIFVGTMIHTALGISEKDFLKYTDMGKQAFTRTYSI